MSNQIPGVPEGWELVRFGVPGADDHWLDRDGQISSRLTHYAQFIIRKIEKPARYRPFANAAEFKPHRYRWLTRKDNGQEMRTTSFCDSVHFTGNDGDTWEAMFEDYIFDDGTPFGVRIDE